MSELKNIIITTPTYDDVVPSTGTPVSLKPFRVGDEKALLIASEGNGKQMANTLKSIISKNVDPIDVDEIASFDLEYLFLKLRAISVGETSKIGIKCENCDKSNEVLVDLTSVEVKKDENHTNMIRIDDKLGFEMKYAHIDEIFKIDTKDTDSVLDLVAHSVKTVYFNEDTIAVGKAEISDMVDLLNDMSSQQFEKIRAFFETMPKLQKEISFTCQECEAENIHTLEGMQNFF